MQDQYPPEKRTVMTFGLQDIVALTLTAVTVAVAITLIVSTWNHWREQSFTELSDIPHTLREPEELEKELTTIRISLAESKNGIADLSKKLTDATNALFNPGPPPQYRVPWNKLAWNVFSGTLQLEGVLLVDRAFYEVEYRKWQFKKELSDKAAATVAALRNDLKLKNKHLATLTQDETALSLQLAKARQLIADERATQTIPRLTKTIWNDWLGPLMHLGLIGFFISIAINLVFRLVLLRGWIGVHKI